MLHGSGRGSPAELVNLCPGSLISRHSCVSERARKFEIRSHLSPSARPVIGDVSCCNNHASIAVRSYVWPSVAMHGSCMRSCVIGHSSAAGGVAVEGAARGTTAPLEAIVPVLPNIGVGARSIRTNKLSLMYCRVHVVFTQEAGQVGHTAGGWASTAGLDNRPRTAQQARVLRGVLAWAVHSCCRSSCQRDARRTRRGRAALALACLGAASTKSKAITSTSSTTSSTDSAYCSRARCQGERVSHTVL